MPFPNPDTQFKPGQSGNPAGKPKGRKSLSTMVRDYLEQDIDWKTVPLKNTEEFREQYGDGLLAGEILVRAAFSEAMGKGGTQAREWLRKSGYGDKLQLGGDEDNPTPILATLIKDVPTDDSAKEDSQPQSEDSSAAGGNGGGEDDSSPAVPDKPSPDSKE